MAKKGEHLSEETKRKISEITKQLWKDPIYCMKQREVRKADTFGNRGKHHTEMTRLKISLANKGKHHYSDEVKRRISVAHKGKLGYWLGKSRSEETKRKISKAHRGKPPWNKGRCTPDEVKQKLSLAHKGKHPTEEARRKMCEFHRNNPPWNKGGHLPEETKNKISETLRGRPSGRKGCHLSEDTKRKLSEALRGRLSPNKGKHLSEIHKKKLSDAHKKLFQNEEFREKMIEVTLKASRKRPTSYEQKIINLCDKHSLPFSYVGDGKVLINYKNPDFIENNGKKLLIEAYGKFWHGADYEQKRSLIFSKYGYKTLFLSDGDVLIDNWEDVCLNKIKNFLSEK